MYLVYVYIQDTHTHIVSWLNILYLCICIFPYLLCICIWHIYIQKTHTKIFVYLTSCNYSYLICIYIGHAHQQIFMQNLLYILYIYVSFYVSYKCISPLYIHIFTTHAHTYAYTYLRIFPIYLHIYISYVHIYIYIYIGHTLAIHEGGCDF